jgi:hypothetical protein
MFRWGVTMFCFFRKSKMSEEAKRAECMAVDFIKELEGITEVGARFRGEHPDRWVFAVFYVPKSTFMAMPTPYRLVRVKKPAGPAEVVPNEDEDFDRYCIRGRK